MTGRTPPPRPYLLLSSAGIACLLLILSLLSSCDDTTTGPGESPSSIVFPDSGVSYALHVQPLFNQACTFSGCHGGGTLPPGRVRFEAYGDWITTPGVIVPGNPDQSEIVGRIEGRIGARMPLNMNSLNSNQIGGIRRWIQNGAMDN